MANVKEIEENLRNGALNIITAVKYDLDMINAINHMTFLFDPNWQGIGNTLPIAFFFVKSFQEVMESDISQKTLLFYNSQSSNNPNAVTGGLLGTVADNIINKPKKYQMQILIPRTIEVYLKQAVFSKRVDWTELFNFPNIPNVDTNVQKELLRQLIGALSASNLTSLAVRGVDIAEYISDSISGAVNDTNKASIEAMWENRTILRMKYWNGWNFKYIAIENYSPSKSGEESDFYEATLNVTEVPIITARRTSSLNLGLIQGTQAQAEIRAMFSNTINGLPS